MLRRSTDSTVEAVCSVGAQSEPAPLEEYLETLGCGSSVSGIPWVTSFEISNYDPQTKITDPLLDDMLIFCKLYNAESKTFSYCGHVYVQHNARCLELFHKVADKACIEEGAEFYAFHESGDYSVQEVNQFYSLEQVRTTNHNRI